MTLFKKNKKTELNKPEKGFKNYFVDNLFIIELPDNWTKVESDRFRAVAEDGKLNFSMSNFRKKLNPPKKFSIDLLVEETKQLFIRFVQEGGYKLNIEDSLIGKNFIYQSFEVGDENQYLYFTYRENLNFLLRSNLMLRVKKKFDPKYREILLKIGENIMTKIV